jgi:quercetin dioxygenase-like cupin family protein
MGVPMLTAKGGPWRQRIAATLTAVVCMSGAAAPPATVEARRAEQALGKHPEPWLPFAELPSGAMRQELYGDPARDGSYMYVRFPAGYRLTSHSHLATERIYVDEGILDVHLCGHPSGLAEEGAAIFVGSQRRHTIACVSQRDCFFYLSLDRRFDARWHPETGACRG